VSGRLMCYCWKSRVEQGNVAFIIGKDVPAEAIR
jgi:hypothetical protein